MKSLSVAQRAGKTRFLFSVIAATAATLTLSAAAYAGGHGAARAPQASDIVDTAVAAGSFNTLVAAVQAADLVDALKGEGPFTVFAPTDEAFAALPAGTLDELLKPENKATLQSILLYHVVAGKIMSGDIGASASPATLQGATIDVKAGMGGVTVNGANVVAADVAASNGVIHVIDAVILPPSE
ncbi:MAG: fasciclin domain-containing protein [Chromatiales bacterium]|nr:fasciclin domain-containing protein [Chromatiales bacterium]